MDKLKLRKWASSFAKIYTAVILIYQMLWQVIPVRAFMCGIGLDKISPVLAVIGFAFLAADVFIEKTVFQSRYSGWLIAAVGAMCVSSLVYIKYGWADNAKVIVWQAVQMFLVYSMYLRMDSKQAKAYLGKIFGIVSVVFMTAVIVSLYQFVFQISYIAEVDGGVYRQGFQEGRLFGIFGNINHASLLMCFMGGGAVYCLFASHKAWVRALMGIQAGLSLLYVVLTGTRSTLVGMIFAAALCSFIGMRNIAVKKNFGRSACKRALCAAGAAVICVVLLYGTYLGTYKLMVRVPVWIGTVDSEISGDIPDDRIEIPGRLDTQSGDISNNRFAIWKDYINCDSSGIKSILFGYSPGSYMKIIKDKFPDIYIVEYARDKFPQIYIQDRIYEAHNSYLTLLTGTGMIGFIVMGTFLVLSALRALKCFIKHKQISKFAVLLAALLGMILIFLVFESVVFHAYTSISVVFWLIMGFMAKEIDQAEAQTENEAAAV